MTISKRSRCTTARRSLKKSVLHQERLVHFFDGAFVLANRCRDCLHSDRTALEFLDDRLENARVHVVETELIDIEKLQRFPGDIARDASARFYLGIITDSSQQ